MGTGCFLGRASQPTYILHERGFVIIMKYRISAAQRHSSVKKSRREVEKCGPPFFFSLFPVFLFFDTSTPATTHHLSPRVVCWKFDSGDSGSDENEEQGEPLTEIAQCQVLHTHLVLSSFRSFRLKNKTERHNTTFRVPTLSLSQIEGAGWQQSDEGAVRPRS